ncbi:MAG TPA: DUF1631 domain-containing protein [Spongiibacteraceae bacterium]|nr:DUF1631 domain-containing protein [Spongiibacteraceae bacterium]
MSKEKDYLKMVEGSANAWSAFPPLIRQLKDDAIIVLLNNLEDLFSNCDDLFFDLSSRASSNAEQNLYFESMRELRFKKIGAINAFKQNFEQNFLALAQAPASSRPNAQENLSADNLTLVQNDTLEQEVAITGMIAKARTNSQEAIYHLTTRLDYLIPRITIDQDNNPLDPEQICRSFAAACELLDINIKAKIIIFKQFDRLVVGKLIKVYSAANELLINSGVLPKITRSINKAADEIGDGMQAQGFGGIDSLAAAQAAPLQFDFIELSNLLASMRRLGLTQLPNYNAFSNNPGPVINTADFLALLAPQQLASSVFDEGSAPGIDLRQLVQSLLASRNPSAPNALPQPDEDVINLVAMFFDFVLDDRNLPVPIQALISRLQIPILKVALKDKSFFNHSGHPARKLINIIADASIGWDESEQPKKDKLYTKIFEIIQAINEQYADNEQIFVDKLAELQSHVEQEQHRNSLVERRTSQSIEGQAKTQQAKAVVQQLLFSRLEKLQLPITITAFLVEQWQQLLVLVYLKHGEDSAEWMEALQLVDDLIWASNRHDDARSLQRLGKIKTDLLLRIANGLTKISATAEASQEAIRAIGEVLDQLQTQAPVEFRPISAEQAITLGHTPGSGSKSWQEMTALERQQARYKALTYEFIKKADALPVGSWLSYEDSKRGKILRCKLATKIEVSDTFVFVNRFGFKVMEKTRKDFAYDLQQRRALPLENGILFDRAMENIVNNLRQISK